MTLYDVLFVVLVLAFTAIPFFVEASILKTRVRLEEPEVSEESEPFQRFKF